MGIVWYIGDLSRTTTGWKPISHCIAMTLIFSGVALLSLLFPKLEIALSTMHQKICGWFFLRETVIPTGLVRTLNLFSASWWSVFHFLHMDWQPSVAIHQREHPGSSQPLPNYITHWHPCPDQMSQVNALFDSALLAAPLWQMTCVHYKETSVMGFLESRCNYAQQLHHISSFLRFPLSLFVWFFFFKYKPGCTLLQDILLQVNI